MNNINQCYEILRIKPGASPEEVKLAYRDLAMVWHPDRFAANNPRLKEKAQEELKKINAAYEVLKSHLTNQQHKMYHNAYIHNGGDDIQRFQSDLLLAARLAGLRH